MSAAGVRRAIVSPTARAQAPRPGGGGGVGAALQDRRSRRRGRQRSISIPGIPLQRGPTLSLDSPRRPQSPARGVTVAPPPFEAGPRAVGHAAVRIRAGRAPPQNSPLLPASLAPRAAFRARTSLVASDAELSREMDGRGDRGREREREREI
eukprot:9357060-Pyramimonas_sp.AAC.1